MNLIDHLSALSALWTAENDRSLSRLATLVVNDGKFFDRLEKGASPTVATLYRFLDFFRSPTNWPGDTVPVPAAVLLSNIPSNHHADPDSADAASARGGKSDKISAPASAHA